eukprot:774180-Pyramimonas_sp.AAC.1
MLLPHGVALLEYQVMVPGCAVAAVVRQGEIRFRVVSVYLPPSRKEDTLSEIAIFSREWEHLDTYWGGGANLQLDEPRDGEVEASALLRDLLASTGSAAVHSPGPARIDRESEPQIDMLACPVRQTYAHEVRRLWRLILSDHAPISI